MTLSQGGIDQRITEFFSSRDIFVVSVKIRNFLDESIAIVEVPDSAYTAAVAASSEIDLGANVFVTIRRAALSESAATRKVQSLKDERVSKLMELIRSRTRVSENQPSLEYIVDVRDTLATCLTPRHHLIFGRRGVGKSALMANTKSVVENNGDLTAWLNLQSFNALDASTAFAHFAERLLEIPIHAFAGRVKPAASLDAAKRIQEEIRNISPTRSPKTMQRLVPALQKLMRQFCAEAQQNVFIFLDDIHYLPMSETPRFLDMVHGVTRDNPVYLKIAGIKHQTRWFSDNPPVGLQIGHDAEMIDLDVTLENPGLAKSFLSQILAAYCERVGISSTAHVVSPAALDRLVLASGGVPRDFLVLSADSIKIARERPNARSSGVQDVNEAAGEYGKVKTQELERDAATSIGSAAVRLRALEIVRDFLLGDDPARPDKKKFTFFRVSFSEKEAHSREYDLLQSLMDLRMIHLLNGSLSDGHHAGQRFEVYMLDLSRYSASRFQRNLQALDFQQDALVLRETGTTKPIRAGDAPKKLTALLRLGPEFGLGNFSNIANGQSTRTRGHQPRNAP
jgi:AAA ATPase domain